MSPDQLTFPETPNGLARRRDPATSKRAARRAPSLEAEILSVFAVSGRMTDDELAARLPHRLPASVKTARSRLSSRRHGVPPRLVWDGTNRPSNVGSPMMVWAVAR